MSNTALLRKRIYSLTGCINSDADAIIANLTRYEEHLLLVEDYSLEGAADELRDLQEALANSDPNGVDTFDDVLCNFGYPFEEFSYDDIYN